MFANIANISDIICVLFRFYLERRTGPIFNRRLCVAFGINVDTYRVQRFGHVSAMFYINFDYYMDTCWWESKAWIRCFLGNANSTKWLHLSILNTGVQISENYFYNYVIVSLLLLLNVIYHSCTTVVNCWRVMNIEASSCILLREIGQ